MSYQQILLGIGMVIVGAAFNLLGNGRVE